MGKIKENPKNTVLCFRAAEDQLLEISAAIPEGTSRAEFLLLAAIEKARRDQQDAFDRQVRKKLSGAV